MSPQDVVDNVADFANVASFLERGMLDLANLVANGARGMTSSTGQFLAFTEPQINMFNGADYSISPMGMFQMTETYNQLNLFAATMVSSRVNNLANAGAYMNPAFF
jgi:hypothetical protein